MSIKVTHRAASGFFPWNLPLLGPGVWPGPTNCKLIGDVSGPLPQSADAGSYLQIDSLERAVEWYWKVKSWTVTVSATWNTWYDPGFGPHITDFYTLSGSASINAQNAAFPLGAFAGADPDAAGFGYNGNLLVPAAARTIPRFTFDPGGDFIGLTEIMTFTLTDVNSQTGTHTTTPNCPFSLFASTTPTRLRIFPPPVFKQGSEWLVAFNISLGSGNLSSVPSYSFWEESGVGTIDGVSFPLYSPPGSSGGASFSSPVTASLDITRTDW